jgi:hypothetical protein
MRRGLLVGKGDVDAGEAEMPNTLEQQLQLVPPGAGDLDELIVAAKVQRLGGPFVHGRRGGLRDRRTEQAGKNATARGARIVGGGIHRFGITRRRHWIGGIPHPGQRKDSAWLIRLNARSGLPSYDVFGSLRWNAAAMAATASIAADTLSA